MTPGAMYDIKHLGSIKLQNRVRFIRSNMEEVRHDLSERIVREHYVVVIDYDGNIQTFFPNPYESYRWVVDLRRTFDWQQTKVIDCSTIRSNTLATVNAVKGTPDKSLGILIWNTKTATLTDFIDNIPDIIQVRWSPPHKFRESLLLVSSKKLITAYDVDAKNFVWIIMEPNVRLYTNSFCIIAYGEKSGMFYTFIWLLNRLLFSLFPQLPRWVGHQAHGIHTKAKSNCCNRKQFKHSIERTKLTGKLIGSVLHCL